MVDDDWEKSLAEFNAAKKEKKGLFSRFRKSKEEDTTEQDVTAVIESPIAPPKEKKVEASVEDVPSVKKRGGDWISKMKEENERLKKELASKEMRWAESDNIEQKEKSVRSKPLVSAKQVLGVLKVSAVTASIVFTVGFFVALFYFTHTYDNAYSAGMRDVCLNDGKVVFESEGSYFCRGGLTGDTAVESAPEVSKVVVEVSG